MPPTPYPLEAVFGRVISPFEQFLRRTTAGGIVLIAATAAALAIAWLAGDTAVHDFWDRHFLLRGERIEVDLAWHGWINDALMALFFLLAGLELKREVLVGELSSVRDAALPVAAAVGGMTVPALIYALLAGSSAHASGWGIPMATDIAFAVGILVLLDRRIPRNLVVFLMALAIADDLGAVLVIALFYTAEIRVVPLATATALFLLLVLLNRGGVRSPLPYVLVGFPLWYAIHGSGIHATLAGVLLALAIPARPKLDPARFDARIEELLHEFRDDRSDARTPDDALGSQRMASIAAAMERSSKAVQSPLQRLEHALAPWVAFVVIPLFALSNAGIDLSAVRWREALASEITLGVLAGLALGKFVGIALFAAVAVRVGWARLPSGVAWRQLLGAAWLGGIGFTMSLFIAQLAFSDAQAIDEAKIGILLASAVSATVGLAWLYLAGRRAAEPQALRK